MKNPFSGLFRARDKPQDSVSAAPVFYFGTSGSGKSVTVQSAIQLSTVYACVRVISETIASLPLGIYETVNDGNEKATDHVRALKIKRLVYDKEQNFTDCLQNAISVFSNSGNTWCAGGILDDGGSSGAGGALDGRAARRVDCDCECRNDYERDA